MVQILSPRPLLTAKLPVRFLLRKLVRPLVKATSSRICIIPSQPARFTAGPMNLEQMSRSLRSFLFIRFAVIVLQHVVRHSRTATRRII